MKYENHTASQVCTALPTGLYQHQAGIGHMTADPGHPSHQGYLNNRCVTIAETLEPAGYFTAISGKSYDGSDPEHWPLKRGFVRFYGTPRGSGHHYRNLPGRDLVLNGKVIPMPEDWYSTTAFTDHAAQFIDEGVNTDRHGQIVQAYSRGRSKRNRATAGQPSKKPPQAGSRCST